MGWIKSFKNSDGSYDSFDWSIETDIGMSIVTFGCYLFIWALTSALFSMYLLIFYGVLNSKRRVQNALGGIIASIIWLLDYKFGLVGWHILHENYSEILITITAINIITILINLIILFFDSYVDEFFEGKYGWLGAITAFSVIIYKLLPITTKIINNMFTMADVSILTSL